MWETFLIHADVTILCRPFTDSKVFATSTELEFFTDTSGVIGFGCFFSSRWTFGNWNKRFLTDWAPSIEFLELFALCAGVFTWENEPELNNNRLVLFCDNQAVVAMINNTTSSIKQSSAQ